MTLKVTDTRPEKLTSIPNKKSLIDLYPDRFTGLQWLSSLAFSRKESGKLCVCLDPKGLNAAIRRTYHTTPAVEEISHRLEGTRIFSKLDAKSGYWATKLDQESSSLTSFNASSSRY